MSTIFDRKFKTHRFHIERFESAMEVAETCKTRQMTSSAFDDIANEKFGKWEGVKSYDEALELLRNGYQPTVEAMRDVFKANVKGTVKRFTFQNAVQGFAPVVPLALKGVPNCMIDMRTKPIKAKVLDVYYDMTARCGIDSDDIIKAGQTLLGAIIELEKQGYRFNLYAVQSYYNGSGDVLAVKVKSSDQPLDLKRISFPLTHTAFFRVIGFDWYSKVPGGTYRGDYGHAVAYDYSDRELKEMAETLFGKNSVYFSSVKLMEMDKDHVREVMTNGNSKA